MSNQKFKLLKWPAQGPDLNLIENLWTLFFERRLAVYERAPTNMDELWQRVKEEWKKILDKIIQNLVESMTKRSTSKNVKKNKGLWTKY